MMKIVLSLKRMDSLMVASNIKRLRRLELLYTCVADLAKEILKHEGALPEGLIHYTQADDWNWVINHKRSGETSDKVTTVLKDAGVLKKLYEASYDEFSNY